MGFEDWGTSSEQYKAWEQVKNHDKNDKHKAHLSHEVIAAAASYEAAKAYQDHLKKNGKPTSHEKAKEIFAGLAGFAVTHIVETKGLDAYDKHKQAKLQQDAHKHAEHHIAKHY